MEKFNIRFTNLIEWIDCFEVKVFRWYLKLKTIFRVLMFLPITVLTLLITVVTTILVFLYDVFGLLVCAVLDVSDHIQRAKIMNEYEEKNAKMMNQIKDSES